MTVNKQDGPVDGKTWPSSGHQNGNPKDEEADPATSSVDGNETPSTSNEPGEPGTPERSWETLNVPDGSPKSDAKSSSGHSGLRSTSSKFASLRATFEQSAPADDNSNVMRRRLASPDKSHEATGEQKEAYEIEIVKLKEELEREKKARTTFEEKGTGMDDELEKEKGLRMASEDKATDLAEELEKEKELRISYEEKVTGLEEELESLHSDLAQRDEQWRGEFEKRSAELMEAAESRLDLMAGQARSREEEALNLQKQLSDLKQGIATSTRGGLQVSDTTFKQEFDTLQYEVQNWVVNHFRRVKIEASAKEMCERLEKVAEVRHLKHLKPLYEQYDSRWKIPILQATVAAYLLEIFDEPYLYGLQGQGEFGKRAKQAADTLSAVLDPEAYHRWRALTFDAIRRSESIKEPVDNAASGVAEMICIVLKALTDPDDTENRQPSLKPIILRAISVAHLVRIQQATYEFQLPSLGDDFDADAMESIVEDLDDDDKQTVRCATFPAITKTGDVEDGTASRGGVVVKAKVLCMEDAADES